MITQSIEKVFNKILKEADLTKLEGKVIAFNIKRPSFSLFLQFGDNYITVTNEYDQTPDTEIYATLFQLIKMKAKRPDMRTFMSGDFYIKGDTACAEQLDKLFREHNIDWEEYVSKAVGDVAAHNIGKLVRKNKKVFKKAGGSMKQNISEFIQEEAEILPAKQAVNDFADDCDELNLRAERLNAKMNLLTAKGSDA